jgi:ergothioneine biosynthesis protein EgtB
LHVQPSPHLIERFAATRRLTERLVEPLSAEDCQLQAMPDASPPKWHLAHTSWFFEEFVLKPFAKGYEPFDPRFQTLFNSYYESVSEQWPRPRRGLLSRPSLADVLRYREHVTVAVHSLHHLRGECAKRIEIGIAHEEQHQELLLTDIKAGLALNPLRPSYRSGPPSHAAAAPRMTAVEPAETWIPYDGGIVAIGHGREGGSPNAFAFDNEGPRHEVFLRPFAIARSPVTNAEFLAFMEDGGYARADLWLSDGWRRVQSEGWRSPLYWELVDGQWHTTSLDGFEPVRADEPVPHLSYYEAQAYAAWRGARLPTEAEWEAVAAGHDAKRGHFLDSGALRPRSVAHERGAPLLPAQLYGDVWEWTQSAYLPYPGFRAPAGALGEYNGKFMVGQMVLRGGSCVTPPGHVRATYRNFFPPEARWQYSGVRLARDP